VKAAIESEPWLADQYDIGENYIRGRKRAAGTEFMFRGLHHNATEVKSIRGVKRCWVEEADLVSKDSWSFLTPTIREPGSQIWVTFNPSTDQTATYQMFVKNAALLERAMIVHINADDNPWLSQELIEERRRDQHGDPDAYRNKWLGEPLTRTDAQVFGGRWVVREFAPNPNVWDGPYQGLDFGFSQDPTAATRCWIHADELWIEYAAGGVGIDLDEIADEMCSAIPGFEKYETAGDNARPDSISYLRKPRDYSKHLPRLIACEKGAGSIEDGVEFIKSFKRVNIHPRCGPIIREASLYSYKTDRLTGAVLDTIIDANNHWWDAVRYSLEKVRKNRGSVMAALQKRR
jgi:phage terminase large subunit